MYFGLKQELSARFDEWKEFISFLEKVSKVNWQKKYRIVDEDFLLLSVSFQ